MKCTPWVWVLAAITAVFVAKESTAGESLSETEGSETRVSAFGRVVDTDQKPAAGVTVALHQDTTFRHHDEMWNTGLKGVLATTRTDKDGRFRFQDVPARPSRFWTHSQPPSSPPSSWQVVVRQPGRAIAWQFLPAADSRDLLDIRLQPEAAVRGRVVDQNGKPISNVAVHVGAVGNSRELDKIGFPVPVLTLQQSSLAPATKTGADGSFTIGGLPNEQAIALVFEHDEFALEAAYVAISDHPQPDVHNVAPDRRFAPRSPEVHIGDFTLTMQPAQRLDGEVVWADSGLPARGVKILLGESHQGFQTVSDDAGHFSFRSMPNAKYRLTAFPPEETAYLGWRTSVKFAPGQLKLDVKIRLPMGQGVAGEVLDEESRDCISGVAVLYDTDTPDGVDDVPLPHSGMTDSKGRFQFVVPPGKGRLRIGGPVQHYDLPSRFERRQSLRFDRFRHAVEVSATMPTTGIHFDVGRGMVVRGVVSDEKDVPAAGLEVALAPGMPNRMKYAATRTDEKGRFVLDGLPVNSDQILVVTDTRRKLQTSVRIKADNLPDPVQPVDVEITLRRTGTMRGQVQLDGKPVDGGLVTLTYGGEPIKDPVDGFCSVPYAHTRTDADGRFEFEMVEANVPFKLRVRAKDANERIASGFAVQPREVLEIPVQDLGPAPKNAAAKTLTITIVADEKGQVASITVGLAKLFEGPLDENRLRMLGHRLKDALAVEASFSRVLLRTSKNLDDGELRKIIRICTQQKTADGKPVDSVDLAEVLER